MLAAVQGLVFDKVISGILSLAGQSSTALTIKHKLGLDSNKDAIKSIIDTSIERAQKSVNISEEVVEALYSDDMNQAELSFWITNHVQEDQFESRKNSLNYEFVVEQYIHESDKILPFFKSVLKNVNEYKKTSWSPEILELISNTSRIEEKVDSLQTASVQISNTCKKTASDLNALSGQIDPIHAYFSQLAKSNCDDIQQLFDEGQTIVARERALERLKDPLLSPDMKSGLYLLISNTYINNEDGAEDALKYMRLSVDLCSDPKKKIRLLFYVHQLSGDFTQAEANINQQAIDEGYTEKVIDSFIFLYMKMNDYKKGYSLIEKIEDADKKDLCLAIFKIIEEEYDDVISLYLMNGERVANIDWRLQYIQAKVYGSLKKIQKKIQVNLVSLYNSVFPIIESLMSNEQLQNRLQILLAHLLYICDRNEECKSIVSRLYKQNTKKYSSLLICVSLRLEDFSKVIEICEEKGISSCTAEERAQYLIACIQFQSLDKAEKFIAQYIQSFFANEDDRLFIFRQKMLILFQKFDISGMKQVILDAEDAYPEWHGINGLKGYSSFLQEDWNNAIEYLREHVIDDSTSSQRDLSVYDLVQSYNKKKDSIDYDFLEKIIPTARLWQDNPFLKNYYIKSLYENKNFALLIAFYEDADFPRSDYLIEAAATTYFNFMWFEKSYNAYSILNLSKQNLLYVFQLARCKHNLGQYRECSQITAIVENKIMHDGSAEELMLLSRLFLDFNSYVQSFNAAYKAYIISEKSPESCGNFIAIHVYCGNYIPKNEYDQRWTEAFQNIIEKKLIPFEVFNVADKNGEVTEESLQKIVDRLSDSSNTTDKILGVFRQFSLPSMMLSAMLDRGPYETWKFVTQSSGYKTIVDITGNDWTGKVKCFQGNKPDAILDLASLFPLFEIGIEHNIGLLFDDMFITQDQFDLLLEEYRNLISDATDGKNSLYCQEGKLHLIEVSPEKVQEQLKITENAINWIQKNTTIIGRSFEPSKVKDAFYRPPQINVGLSSRWEKFDALIDSAISMKTLVVLDSAQYIGLIGQQFQVSFVNVLDIVSGLREKDYISNFEYISAITKLYSMGYHALPINAVFIFVLLQTSSFNPNSASHPIFNFFGDEGFLEDYRTHEAGELIYFLFIQQIDKNLNKDYIKSILSKLFPEKKAKEASCNKIISTISERVLTKSQILFDNIIELIDECFDDDAYVFISEEDTTIEKQKNT